MLAIRAMAEMGPWILTVIEVLDGRREQCARCGTRIKNVWVMEKQTEPKERWRIGSECGPNLEAMSEDLWQRTTRPLKTSLDHVVTLDKLARWELDPRVPCPAGYMWGWARELQQQLAGNLSAGQRRAIGSAVSQANKAWVASRRRVAAQIPVTRLLDPVESMGETPIAGALRSGH